MQIHLDPIGGVAGDMFVTSILVAAVARWVWG